MAAWLLVVCWRDKDKRGTVAQAGAAAGVPGSITGMYNTLPLGHYVSSFAPVECRGSPCNEGYYYGWWDGGMPEGRGHLEYDGSGDGRACSINMGDVECRALYYEGQFARGCRDGEGVVQYEGGHRDEGTFYGVWSEGKAVFRGKRWIVNDTYSGYYDVEVRATSPSEAECVYGPEWHPAGWACRRHAKATAREIEPGHIEFLSMTSIHGPGAVMTASLSREGCEPQLALVRDGPADRLGSRA